MQSESRTDNSRARSRGSSRPLLSICHVRVDGDFKLTLDLSDGRSITRDFSVFVRRQHGLLKRLQSAEFFNRVELEDGELTWPGGLDINPLRVIYGADWSTSRKVDDKAVV